MKTFGGSITNPCTVKRLIAMTYVYTIINQNVLPASKELLFSYFMTELVSQSKKYNFYR